MALDLSRRRFIIGAFASVAGVAATPAILQAAQLIPKPKLEWDPMLDFLRKVQPECYVKDESTAYANFVSIEWRIPHLGPGPKMFIGWHTPEWDDLSAEQQQESAEFINQNMAALIAPRQRAYQSLQGREEFLMQDTRIGIYAHGDN